MNQFDKAAQMYRKAVDLGSAPELVQENRGVTQKMLGILDFNRSANPSRDPNAEPGMILNPAVEAGVARVNRLCSESNEHGQLSPNG